MPDTGPREGSARPTLSVRAATGPRGAPSRRLKSITRARVRGSDSSSDPDVASVAADTEGAVRRVVVGTVMIEPVLAPLRLLAQRQVSMAERDAQE